MDDLIQWLLDSPEPWTRYRTLVDLMSLTENNPEVVRCRSEMVNHPQVKSLIDNAREWGGRALKRHNDASHPLYALSTLADFGIKGDDPGMTEVISKVLAHQSPEGAFLTPLFIPKAFGGPDTDIWTWVACDAPTLLYALLAMGLEAEPAVQKAGEHLVQLANDIGYRCSAAAELGRFRGPGKREDPCPIANVYALKALAHLPQYLDSSASRAGAEMLLRHWENQRKKKYYLFGIGTDFRKLKYPFVWYDILHVCDVLSRFAFVHADPRFTDLLDVVVSQADAEGRYTAGSMYQAWKGWSFSDKRSPSPWLTYLVLRVQKRVDAGMK